jgi:hypothetical protein
MFVCFFVIATFLDGGGGAHPKNTCQNNLRNLGGVLVYRATDKRWPEEGRAAFLLQLWFTEPQVRRDPRVFVCPGDDSIPDGGGEAHVALFETLEPDLADWPDGLTSYAGRDQTRYPLLRDSEEKQAIACDRGAFHETGLNVLFEDGQVKFFTWEDLGLEDGDDLIVGPRGPDLLRPLRYR